MDKQVKKKINMQNNNGKKFLNILFNFIENKERKDANKGYKKKRK